MHYRNKIYSIILLMLFAVKICCAQQTSTSNVDSLVTLLKSSTDTTKIRVLNALSANYYDKMPDKAIDYAKQAMTLSQKYKSDVDMGRSLLNIGRGYYSKADYSKSLSFCLEAKKKFESIRDKVGVADVFMAMSSVYTDLGSYANSLNYNLQALTIREELNDSAAMGSSLLNVGLVYYKLRKLRLANEYYNKSLKIRMLRNDQAGISACYNNMANVCGDNGDNLKALEYLQKSLAIKEKLGNKKGIASTLNNMGSVYTSLKIYGKAREYYLKSYELKKEIGDQLGMANTLGNIGGNYYFTNDKKNAIVYFLEAIEAAKQIGAGDILLTNYRNAAQTYYEDGNYKASAEMYTLASDLKDSIYDVEGVKSMNEMQAKFDFEKQDKELKIIRQNDEIHALDANRQRLFKNGFIIGFILLLIIAFVIFNRYQLKQKANAKLEEQKQEIVRQHKELNIAYSQIEAKNKDITDSIKYAKRIQLAFLPRVNFQKEFNDNGFILYKPKDIVSGDFYWMERKNNQVLLAAVDCTGHGVPGAFMSIVGFNLLNQAVNEHKITQPSLILDEMNTGVTDTLRQYEEDSTVKDGMDIALCNIDLDTLQLQYAGAYNSLWIVRNGELIELSANKFPVGTFVGETIHQFNNKTFQLQKGDNVYLFTDGYADQFGGPQGKKFKYKQLQKLLTDNYLRTAPEQKDILQKTFESWIGNLEQVDDVLVIGVKI
ncbi:MAG: protein serine/threonine phosphatase [Bacteroidetes bacterium]|nr:protein serine/threonine phosphatase [Bacteroidota bacterium]